LACSVRVPPLPRSSSFDVALFLTLFFLFLSLTLSFSLPSMIYMFFVHQHLWKNNYTHKLHKLHYFLSIFD
jgi:hypothetical protein